MLEHMRCVNFPGFFQFLVHLNTVIRLFLMSETNEKLCTHFDGSVLFPFGESLMGIIMIYYSGDHIGVNT